MILPNAPFALLALLALLPGWLFVRLAERRGPRPERSSLAELLELAAVGFSAIVVSALIVAGLSFVIHPWLFNVRAWAHERQRYLGDHLGAALISTTFGIVLSCLLVILLYVVIYGRRSTGFKPGSSVWVDCLGNAPKDMQNWLGVHRRDGSLIEGLLLSYPAGPDKDIREISLSKPIRLTPPGGESFYLPIHRVMIPGDEITTITVIHVPKPVQAGKPAQPERPPSAVLAPVPVQTPSPNPIAAEPGDGRVPSRPSSGM
jgi:hypothetical protein